MGAWHRSVGRGLVLVAIACGGVVTRSAIADEAPISLVDWLKAKGEDASFEARRALFVRLVGGGAYSGSAEQNVRLLEALRAPAGLPAKDVRAAASSSAQVHTLRQNDVDVTYDVSPLVLSLELQEDERRVMERRDFSEPAPPERLEESPILPAVPQESATFVSAALLAQKAKQFDDGLYAAVEEAFEGGADGKREMLRRLRERLAAAGARDPGAEVVEAAARLGRVPGKGPEGIDAGVTRRLADFEADAKRSKPIGFYPWTEELKRVFRQDRMLQTELRPAEANSVVDALTADPAALSTYRRMLRCYERLTNPYTYPDLRARIDPSKGPASDLESVYFLPPSRAHETELAKRLWTDREVPDGANLLEILVGEVQAGRLSLAPTSASGWYDRQTWSFEALLRPETTTEAPHLALGARYRRYLVELFKGLLALTRETHVKQLEDPMCGATAAMPQSSPIGVTLPFTVEPLPTHYARRADAYAFVRSVLEDAFGTPTLETLHRLTAGGPVTADLATELTFMETLFRGAAEVSRSEIGAPDAGTTREAETQRALFRAWTGALATDADLATDARMMVPVFYDVQRRKSKVWVFLGWTRQTLMTSITTPPRVLKVDKLADLPRWDGHVYFYAPATAIFSPVVAEVYVTEILDRAEMRRRCDAGKTRSAILASLK